MDPTLLLSAAQDFPGPMDLVGQVGSAMQQRNAQRWSLAMYERQRRDALEFWGVQNAYNSPQQQMQRYQAAGLNPNLIYGQSNTGGSIQVPDASPVDFREPKFQGRTSMNPLLFADLRIKNAQANNLETQTEVIRQDASLRAWQAKRAGLDYSLEESLYSVNSDARRAGLQKTRVETEVLLNRDAREAAMNASSISEAAERMLTLREQRINTVLDRTKSYSEIRRLNAETARIRQSIELSKKEGILKDLDVKFSKDNIRPGDPLWYRLLSQSLSELFNPSPTTIPLEQYPEIRKPDGSRY